MPEAVEDDVLVHLVGNHDGVGLLEHQRQFGEVSSRQYRSGRIVR